MVKLLNILDKDKNARQVKLNALVLLDKTLINGVHNDVFENTSLMVKTVFHE